MSRTVTYGRDDASVDLPATLGRTAFEQPDEYGALHRIEARDYIINVADLILEDEQVLPRSGDRITDATVVYEVMAFGDEPPWRYCDAHQKSIRIHTKKVG